ncbi:MAG: Gfo/Idh/MocA family oxidoreductase [Planctomycetota bacterium]
MSIKVGVIGLGFMGTTHVRAYQSVGATLVAVLDQSEDRRSGAINNTGNIGSARQEQLFDPDSLNATDDLDAFLATPELELVSICTPTDTHIELAQRVINAGKHLIIEKPVALRSIDVQTIGEQASDAGVLCMPAMCMRFWPAWAYVKQLIDQRTLGQLRSLHLERLGAAPTWNDDFYLNPDRSGGALFDLHIHDTDFINHAIGIPEGVTTTGTANHHTTTYHYPDQELQVIAQGGWLPAPTFPFTMRLLARFEEGVADFDLARDDQLLVHRKDGSTETPTLDPADGWQAEVSAMVNAVASYASEAPATMQSASDSTRILEAERESLARGSAVHLDHSSVF